MTDSLFTSVPQQEGPILEGETTFEFLERGGRKDAIVICQWTKKWFCMFPIDHREELKRRLQSKDFSEFMGAYFELQVFAILQRLNCNVEIHPPFSGTDGTVDFRVTHGQDRFYVEATVCGVNRRILRSNTNEEDATKDTKGNKASSL